MVSREFPSNAFVQYHITAATPPSGLKHGSLKIAGSQRVQPTTDVECIFFHHLLLSAFHSPPFSRRCSSRSERSSFGQRRILSVRRRTPISSTFTKSSTTSRNLSTITTRSDWGNGSLPQLPPAVPFLPYFKPGCCFPSWRGCDPLLLPPDGGPGSLPGGEGGRGTE